MLFYIPFGSVFSQGYYEDLGESCELQGVKIWVNFTACVQNGEQCCALTCRGVQERLVSKQWCLSLTEKSSSPFW